MPGKANCAEQRQFLETVLKPAIESAKNGLCELFFLDASHFVQGGIVGKIWCKIRMWVKTGSGRKRFNVLGALNFVSKKIETVSNDTYITGVQVIEMLELLHDKFRDKAIKIILDRASYQRCQAVTARANELGIELLFLPSYSPNLNLIERFWKFVKANVLNAAYIESFDDYRKTISDFIFDVNGEHFSMLNSLITENFQFFDDCSVIA
jgi:transposase